MIKVNGHRVTKNNLSDFLPWALMVDSSIIMQKDGIFQSTFKVKGHNFFCCSDDKIDTIIATANNLFMYCEEGWTVFVEAQRKQIDYYPKSFCENEIFLRIEQERKDFYVRHPLFDMSCYITFCYKQKESSKKVNAFFSEKEMSLENDIDEFRKKLNDFEGMLKNCFIYVEKLICDELLTYLHSCVSTQSHKVLFPPITMYIDAYVCDDSLSIGETLQLGNKFIGVISVHDFPHVTRADLLEELQMLNIDFRWQTRMMFLSEAQAISDIKRYRRKHYSQRKGVFKVIQEKQSGDEALENTESIMRASDAEEALELVGKNIVRFGYITSVVVVFADDTSELREKLNLVKEVFNKKGFIVKEEQLNAMDAWLSSLPGQVYSNVRRALIHSVNLAHILPLSSRWIGNIHNEHMDKVCGTSSPHMLVRSQNNAFYFNLNNGDVGHTFIVGPTGAGKSTLLGTLGVQFLRYPNAKVIIFDKDFSALPITQKINGRYFGLGSEDNSLSFQPFRYIHQESEQVWALQYCQQLMHLNNATIHGSMLNEFKKGIQLLENFPEDKRTISSLLKIIQEPEIRQVLEKYCNNHMFGDMFDGVEEGNFNDNWLMFEMGYLMRLGQDAVIPALYYLFHRLEQAFDGNPTLLILDEGWLFLQHPAFAEQFKIWLKTLRKKNVFVIMATQEIADAVKSPLLETIISACQTMIYLPDKSASHMYMKDFYYNFGLHEREIEIISMAQPKKEYYIATSEGSCLFSLDLGADTLEILTKKKE